MGTNRRSFYATNGLFDAEHPPGTICVFSTDFDRTRMSARFFLKGMLGDTPATRAIPIRTRIPIDIRQPLSAPNSTSAAWLMVPTDRPNYSDLLEKYVYSTPEWRATNAAWQSQFGNWSRETKLKIHNAHDLITPGDTLRIRQDRHLPPPPGLSPSDAQAIIDAGRWALAYQYETQLGRVTGKELVEKISEYLAAAVGDTTKTNPLKYVLFSAHDSTLLSALSALHSPLIAPRLPPYAASLRFGLVQTGSGFQIVVNYNDGADHPLANPGSPDGKWSLAQFQNLAAQ